MKLERLYFHLHSAEHGTYETEVPFHFSSGLLYTVNIVVCLLSVAHASKACVIRWGNSNSFSLWSCMSDGNDQYLHLAQRDEALLHILIVTGPCTDKWCGSRVKGKKCPRATHTYNCTSFMLKKTFPLLWCSHHNISEKMMERGRELFHWKSHNLVVSHCSGHVHSSCQRQKYNCWKSAFLYWIKIMFTMSHISVWNTKFTNIHSHVCVYGYVCIYMYLRSQTCTYRQKAIVCSCKALSISEWDCSSEVWALRNPGTMYGFLFLSEKWWCM